MFGLYVHIPFCVHKCSYCDFYSFTKYSGLDFERFTDGLISEIKSNVAWLEREGLKSEKLSTIFFGGGTPSLLPMELLKRVIETIQESFVWEPGLEFTLEANPETVTREFCLGLSALPVNRISLGAQSFSPDSLKKLERLGSRTSIEQATKYLTESGFENYSLDLIFGIPGQDWRAIEKDIESAAALRPKHLSFYNLTLKPAHTLYAALPNDDRSAAWYERGVETLEQLGYFRYEISNFSLEGHESQHNMLYWSGGDFLGVGPSAASRLFHGGVFHHKKQLADFSLYLKEAGKTPDWTNWEKTTPAQTILEATFLELRKREGVHLPSFHRRYGYDLRQSKKHGLFIKEGILAQEDESLRLTDRGFLLADTVTADLAP